VKEGSLRSANVEINLETVKTTVSISDFRADISNWELPNSKKCYHSTTKCDCHLL